MPFQFREFWYGDKLFERGFAKLEEGGVIMDVVNADQATIAEEAGVIAI